METIRKNKFLIIAVVAPFLGYLLLLSSVCVANWTFNPQYNFLYVQNLGERGGEMRMLFFNEFEKKDIDLSKIDLLNRMSVKLFIYDVRQNISKEVSFEEVKGLEIMRMTSGEPSPDGYELSPDLGGQFTTEISHFFLDNWNPESMYLRKGKLNIRINLISPYNNPIEPLGWVIK